MGSKVRIFMMKQANYLEMTTEILKVGRYIYIFFNIHVVNMLCIGNRKVNITTPLTNILLSVSSKTYFGVSEYGYQPTLCVIVQVKELK